MNKLAGVSEAATATTDPDDSYPLEFDLTRRPVLVLGPEHVNLVSFVLELTVSCCVRPRELISYKVCERVQGRPTVDGPPPRRPLELVEQTDQLRRQVTEPVRQ